jgi:hypothetical protein
MFRRCPRTDTIAGVLDTGDAVARTAKPPPNIPGLDNSHAVPVEEYDPSLFAGRRPQDQPDSFVTGCHLPREFFSRSQSLLDSLHVDWPAGSQINHSGYQTVHITRLSHFRPGRGLPSGAGPGSSAFPAGSGIRNRAQGSAGVARTVTVVQVTGFFRLIFTGGGNRLTLAGRLEGGDESVGVGKTQR